MQTRERRAQVLKALKEKHRVTIEGLAREFDVSAMTNTDNKGFVREVEEYRVTDFGLYMSRHAPGHPRFDHLESWLLPALGLRANIFHYQGGYREGQRLYLDVGRFAGPDDDGRWHAEDWYLDLVDVPGTPPLLLDTAERPRRRPLRSAPARVTRPSAATSAVA